STVHAVDFESQLGRGVHGDAPRQGALHDTPGTVHHFEGRAGRATPGQCDRSLSDDALPLRGRGGGRSPGFSPRLGGGQLRLAWTFGWTVPTPATSASRAATFLARPPAAPRRSAGETRRPSVPQRHDDRRGAGVSGPGVRGGPHRHRL